MARPGAGRRAPLRQSTVKQSLFHTGECADYIPEAPTTTTSNYEPQLVCNVCTCGRVSALLCLTNFLLGP